MSRGLKISSYSNPISSSLSFRAASVSRGSRYNCNIPVSIVGQGMLLHRLLRIASRSPPLLPSLQVRSGSVCDKDLGYHSWQSTLAMSGAINANVFKFVCLLISINISGQLLKSSMLIVILMACNTSLVEFRKKGDSG